MEIVTQEQINELDGLIEKYKNPEIVVKTVLGKEMSLSKSVDISGLTERRKTL